MCTYCSENSYVSRATISETNEKLPYLQHLWGSSEVSPPDRMLSHVDVTCNVREYAWANIDGNDQTSCLKYHLILRKQFLEIRCIVKFEEVHPPSPSLAPEPNLLEQHVYTAQHPHGNHCSNSPFDRYLLRHQATVLATAFSIISSDSKDTLPSRKATAHIASASAIRNLLPLLILPWKTIS